MTDVETALALGRLALKFARTNRATYHEDGETLESDTDHTVMLALIAMALCPLDLDRGLVAQFAIVHDLIEAYCGDTNSFDITPEKAEYKKSIEEWAMKELRHEFGHHQNTIVALVDAYEMQVQPEARYVRFLDKAMPKITHYLNGGASIQKMGKNQDDLVRSHCEQFQLLKEEYPEFVNTSVEVLMLDLMRKSEQAYTEDP